MKDDAAGLVRRSWVADVGLMKEEAAGLKRLSWVVDVGAGSVTGILLTGGAGATDDGEWGPSVGVAGDRAAMDWPAGTRIACTAAEVEPVEVGGGSSASGGRRRK
ncbi:alanine:glyoxylate aminotransferase [Striga asiatica]|uniref:Alanine:glyoxylate aminotransferase n=1 Tax=Striga asiatica TaxID=4170 RepID=A0A5A7PK13_STRAF|nr:alanine:glyoxylate aminotransferase [Striga asiatica]